MLAPSPVVLLLALGLVACSNSDPVPAGPRPDSSAECRSWITRPALDESLELGRSFILNQQRPEGNFNYEYDWLHKSFDPADNVVRQAGATWGLVLIHQDDPRPQTRQAIERSFAFWEAHSRKMGEDRRYVVYPGDRSGSLGAVALLALAHIDYLRTEGDSLPADQREHLTRRMNEYLGFLVSARLPDGLFRGHYDHVTGFSTGQPSPYSDGEALLALTSAARYLGRDDLKSLILDEAQVGYQANTIRAREKDPDSKITKGYYQWSSMAYYELATSGWEGTEVWGDRAIELADWMIDVHRTLSRGRNTAYAYEGIVSAWEIAHQRGDTAHEAKFGCVIHEGLRKLTSWQVGHTLADRFIREHPTDDVLAIGGVQNHKSEAPLRIDVAQHQMHAVIMARRWFLPAATPRTESTP